MITIDTLKPWDKMLKVILKEQFDNLSGMKILDFGSGDGTTASFLAEKNDVIAIEPSENQLSERCTENDYVQFIGSIEKVNEFDDDNFDMVVCHNVLEYVDDKADYIREFARVLKPGGKLSIVKHNRPGRVMQMAVLLDNFDHANELLDGKDSVASQFGAIRYYEDEDIGKWCPQLSLVSVKGVRTFWDLQQNQEKHKDPEWQKKMIALERRVEEIPEYRNIAFFHHLIFARGI